MELGFDTVGFGYCAASIAATRAGPGPEHAEVERLWSVCDLLGQIELAARKSSLAAPPK